VGKGGGDKYPKSIYKWHRRKYFTKYGLASWSGGNW